MTPREIREGEKTNNKAQSTSKNDKPQTESRATQLQWRHAHRGITASCFHLHRDDRISKGNLLKMEPRGAMTCRPGGGSGVHSSPSYPAHSRSRTPLWEQQGAWGTLQHRRDVPPWQALLYLIPAGSSSQLSLQIYLSSRCLRSPPCQQHCPTSQNNFHGTDSIPRQGAGRQSKQQIHRGFWETAGNSPLAPLPRCCNVLPWNKAEPLAREVCQGSQTEHRNMGITTEVGKDH